MKVQADFKMLNEGVESTAALAKLFGIANISSYSSASAHHRYSATQLGEKLGGTTWHVANKLIERIKREKNVDIKISDNIYHRTELLNKSVFHKYSEAAFVMLKNVQEGKPYEVEI